MSLKKIKAGTKSNTAAVKIILSAVAGLIVSFAIICIFALILIKKDIAPDTVRYFWLAIAFAGSFGAGTMTAKKTKLKTPVSALISGGIISILLIIPIAAVNAFSISSVCFLMIPCALAGGLTGSITGKNMAR